MRASRTTLLLFLLVQAVGARELTIVARDEDGSPVPGADVICVATDHSSWRNEPLRESERGVTGTDGACTFPNLPVDAPGEREYFTYYILARTESLGAWGRADFGSADPASQTLELTLEVGRTLPGRMVDSGGQPLPDVLVFAKQVIPLGASDADGRFYIPNLPAQGHTTIHGFKPGYGWVQEHAQPASQEFVMALPDGGLVHGVVRLPSGDPAVGAVYRAYPFDGTTDDEGRFRAGWFPVDARVTVQCNLRQEDRAHSGQTTVHVQAGDNPVELTLVPPEDRPQRSIAGRVLMQGGGTPVQADILGEYSPQFEWPKRLARTEPDGTYRIDGIQGDSIFIYAKPCDNTLVSLEGVVRVDLRETLNAEGVDFTIEPGCAIRGRVVDHEGNPVQNVQVMWEPMEPFYRAIWTSESGRFLIDNLPEPETPFTIWVETPQHQTVRHEVGLLQGGELAEVTLQFPMPVAQTCVKGRVVDAAGTPIVGANVLFPTETRHIWTNTDELGRFTAEFHGSADADVQVSIDTSVRLGPMQMNVGPKVTIIAGGHLTVPEGATVEDHLIRVTVEPVQTLSGNVVNLEGEPVNARVEVLADEYVRSDVNTYGGQFLVRNLPDRPFVLEVTAPGYRARILEAGKDFTIGGEHVRIILDPGPFAEDVPVWTQVTGRPELETEIVRMPGGREAYRRCQQQYPQMANMPRPSEAGGSSIKAE